MVSCSELHRDVHEFKRFSFPFDEGSIPDNGVYILFEKGEKAHDGDRIVRVGTHTGKNQLVSRLKQHFMNENKDRSIFRKNIGRCLLNKIDDPYLQIWEYDLTTKKSKEQYQHLVDKSYQLEIEKEISKYIQDNFSFAIIKVEDKEDRLRIESGLISLVSLCKNCHSSSDWLGNYSPKQKIKASGLWQVNQLYKEPIKPEDLEKVHLLGVRAFT